MPIQEVRQLAGELHFAGGVPIKSWGIDVEHDAWDQMRNIANLPFAYKHVALMPDAHPGYAMPIGGVLASDGFVVPYAIGVDIGCGVVLYETDILEDEIEPTDIKAVMDQVRRDVPVGGGRGARGNHQSATTTWGIDHGPSDRIATIVDHAEVQLGTLGGGNHFLELQYGADDRKVYFMLHSGSRGLGKKTCDLHVAVAQRLAKTWAIELPHKDVAYLPLDTPEGRAYMADMQFCMDWAVENRRRMGEAAMDAIERHLGTKGRQVADCHHNFAAMENHFGRNLLIHRKGAVRARAGETVLIPGSMSTASYIGKGLGNRDAFMTCQHGAGRLRSRAATKAKMVEEGIELDKLMHGVYLNSAGDVSDESSVAYKDIFAVMEASSDLVAPVQQLLPLGVVKG